MNNPIYPIYDLIKSIVSYFEKDSSDEFYWLDIIFGMFK